MLRFLNQRTIAVVAAASATGFLLACSFPLPPAMSGMEGGSAAWLALIPLFLVLVTSSPRYGMVAGCIAGWIFHLIGLSWLLALRSTWGNTPLTVVAWIALAFYCALYVAVFGGLVAGAARMFFKKGLTGRVVVLLLSGVFWVGLEYIRSFLGTGFPWNLLGVSQYESPALLQPARWVGVYGISYLIVLFNMSLALTVQRVWREIRGQQKRRRVHVELMLGLLVVAICWSWGMRTLLREHRTSGEGTKVRVAVVQPSIPQVQKWSEAHAQEIETVLLEQSELALLSGPELVVWPETATPGLLRTDPASRQLAGEVVAQGAYLLAGTMDVNPLQHAYYNAALLMGTNGMIRTSYNKRHLVPFGEYVPFAKAIPALEKFAPLGFSCLSGDLDQELVTLSFADERATLPMSTLICFEDVFPYLARLDVQRGARLLVNLTNDGWFDQTSAARQHLAHAVFRAVENQVPMVRAANTGVSAFIDRGGRVQEVPGPHAEGSRGWGTRSITIPPVERKLTLYTRYGNWLFAIPCMLVTLLGIFYMTLIDGRRS